MILGALCLVKAKASPQEIFYSVLGFTMVISGGSVGLYSIKQDDIGHLKVSTVATEFHMKHI